MFEWVVVGVGCLVGLATVVFALVTGGRAETRRPVEPEWILPAPVEARRTRFPLSWRGYDPELVDLHLDALATAYEELYLAAGPRTIARARERLALRLAQHGPRPGDAAVGEPTQR